MTKGHSWHRENDRAFKRWYRNLSVAEKRKYRHLLRENITQSFTLRDYLNRKKSRKAAED